MLSCLGARGLDLDLEVLPDLGSALRLELNAAVSEMREPILEQPRPAGAEPRGKIREWRVRQHPDGDRDLGAASIGGRRAYLQLVRAVLQWDKR